MQFSSSFGRNRLLDHLLARKSAIACKAGGAPQRKLLEQFKTSARSVVFGSTDRRGVNVSSEALSNAIITPAPFPVPNHPAIEAQLQFLQERGGDPFTERPLSGPDSSRFDKGLGALAEQNRHSVIIIPRQQHATKPHGWARNRLAKKLDIIYCNSQKWAVSLGPGKSAAEQTN